MNFYQKSIIVFVLSAAIIIFSFNTFFSLFKKNFISILNSDRFDYYIELKVKDFLEKVSEGELSDEDKKYYKEISEKIKKKYKDVF
tara:strand:+ start:785 stop:1042 length:258 start_codon:yes stop_codon:yes gene_type:complete